MKYVITQEQVEALVNGSISKRDSIISSLKPIEPLTEEKVNELWKAQGSWGAIPIGLIRSVESAITGDKS